MNEFFADNIDLWSFNLHNRKFELIIDNFDVQFWREFFQDLSNGLSLERSKLQLLKKVFYSRVKEDVSTSNFLDILPIYIESRTINNLSILENEPEFQSILREIKIKKIIDQP